MTNPLDGIAEQAITRITNQHEKLVQATSSVYHHHEDYCNNLEVTTQLQASEFNPLGFRCKAMAPHASCKSQDLSPEDVDKLCSKQCHECPEYTDYVDTVSSIDVENDEIIEPTDATEDDIDCYYEHTMKEGYHYYDEEKIADFYKARPSIDRYNKLVWAFKSTGLKVGDYLDYAMPADILKEETELNERLHNEIAKMFNRGN